MSEEETGSSQEQEETQAAAAEPEISKVTDELTELTPDNVKVEKNPDLDVILDIPVRIGMEVGHTEITIRDLLQLNQGSVVELDRLAGEPLDVTVNGTLIAHGEVVVINDKFGMRLTDVLSTHERIRNLR